MGKGRGTGKDGGGGTEGGGRNTNVERGTFGIG